MEYQVSWGLGGDTLIMPKQKDVIRGHILRYLTATSKDHVSIVAETTKALETLYKNLNKEEAENFAGILGNIVSDILQDEQIAIDFYKKDREAWAQYIGEDENLRDILTEYAEATSLYEVHVGSADYDRLRGQSGYKFGRDMQKLPKFDLGAFKRKYDLQPKFIPNPLYLDVTIKKLGETSTRKSFKTAYNKAKKQRTLQRKTLTEQYKKLSVAKLKESINEILGAANEIGDEEYKLMQEKYKKGRVKNDFKNQLVNLLVDLQTSIARNESTRQFIDKNIGITFRISNPDLSTIFYSVGNSFKGAQGALENLAQNQLDDKSRQIKDRGVIAGGWTSVAGTEIKFSKGMFEVDEDDSDYYQEEDFKGEVYLPAETTNGNYKNITQFTLEDMIPDTFLKGDSETATYSYELNTTDLLEQLVESQSNIAFLDFQLDEINKVTVNMIEVKFILPSQDTRGISSKDGKFNQRMEALAKRLKEIKVSLGYKTAHVAEWDTSVYSSSQRASRKMQEHLSLFKERVEELVDFYDVEITGQVDDMED